MTCRPVFPGDDLHPIIQFDSMAHKYDWSSIARPVNFPICQSQKSYFSPFTDVLTISQCMLLS